MDAEEKEISLKEPHKKEPLWKGTIARTFERNPWAIYFIVIITVAILYFFVRWIVVKIKAAIDSAPAKYQDGGKDVTESWKPTADNLLNELFAVIDGIDSPASKGLVFTKMVSLSRDQLIYMYNEWKRLYQTKHDGQSMTAAIDAEYYLTATIPYQDELVKKLRNYGLQ